MLRDAILRSSIVKSSAVEKKKYSRRRERNSDGTGRMRRAREGARLLRCGLLMALRVPNRQASRPSR